MAQKFVNGARLELLSSCLAGDTTLSVLGGGVLPVATSGTGAFDSGDWFRLVIQGPSSFEVVLVRSHGAGSEVMTNVLRAQEGTTAQAWAAGTVVGQRFTAADAAAAMAVGTALVNAMSLTYTSGRITGVTEDGVTTTIGYDGSGRVSTVSYPRGGKTRTETYTYNPDGSVAGMTAAEA